MKRYLVVVGLIVAAFLAGYVPAKLRYNSLEQQYRKARLHRLLGMVLIEVQLNNYGTARERATEFFNAVAETASHADSRTRQRLESIQSRRDEIIADLTAMNPEVTSKVRGIFVELPNPEADYARGSTQSAEARSTASAN